MKLKPFDIANWLDATTVFYVAEKLEAYNVQDIRLGAGELSAQEMRAVRAVQRWWVAEIRRLADEIVES